MIDVQKALVWCAAVLVVVLAYLGWRGHERSVGALEAKIATLEAQTKVLSKEADSLENVFRVDTVRLTTIAVKAETTLTRIIDTALIERHDTVRVPVEVLIQSDSVIRACRIVQSDCAKLADTQKAEIADLRAEMATTLDERFARRLWSWVSERLGVGAGYGCVVSGSARCGPTVAAIVRIWP